MRITFCGGFFTANDDGSKPGSSTSGAGGGYHLSATERRAAAILRKIPFTVAFKSRVEIFGSLIVEDKTEHGVADWGRSECGGGVAVVAFMKGRDCFSVDYSLETVYT